VVQGHDPVSYILWVHGRDGGVGMGGVHVRWEWRVERGACIPKCMGRSWKPWSLAGAGRRC
jgi:hypothetical protein